MKTNYMNLQNGSDIRGVALEGIEGESVNLTVDSAKKIAIGFVRFLENETGKKASELKIGIGADGRLSAELLKNGLLSGFGAYNPQVFDCGLCTTPSMFMATRFAESDFDGSIMITASHLPFNRNGFKFFTKNGGLYKNDIAYILEVASEIDSVSDDVLETKSFDLIKYYADFLCEKIVRETEMQKPFEGLKIIVDAGNGAGGFFESLVLKKLGANTDGSLFLDSDGTFPNHIPNPEDKNAIDCICKQTLETGADLGIIFDTDVDRAAVVFKGGVAVNRNAIIALAATLVAKDTPNSYIVTDSVTSDELTVFLENELQLVHHRYKRGYKNVIDESIKLNNEGKNSPLAIETSGHCAFKENFFLDDGAYLVVKILIELANKNKVGKGISSLIEKLEYPKEETECRLKIKEKNFKDYGKSILNDYKQYINEEPDFEIVQNNFEGIRINVIDNGKKSGFILVRLSLHDPILAINIESKNKGGVKRCKEKLLDFFGRYNVDCESLKTN